jgi:hypothetical protein
MKKLASVLLSFLATVSAFATVRVVNNNLNGPGQFTTIQAAHDAASDGDTIYVAPSPSAYAGADISKKIALFGAGMRPGDKKDNSAYSFVNGEIRLNNGSANSVICGMLFNNHIIRVRNGANNIQILRNYWSGGGNHIFFEGGSYTGWIIANNYFLNSCNGHCINMQNQTVTNFLILNNVFAENTGCGISFIGNFVNSANCLFANNLVYGQSNDVVFSSCSNLIVENNIFYTSGPAGCSNCVFNNNITFGTGQDVLPYGSNSGVNNVSNVDPQLTTFSATKYDPFQNFQPAGGPARTGGVGGTQMGVYGGSGFNWNNSAVPPIPQIRSFSLTSGATVPAGGSLNIRVISTKQN